MQLETLILMYMYRNPSGIDIALGRALGRVLGRA